MSFKSRALGVEVEGDDRRRQRRRGRRRRRSVPLRRKKVVLLLQQMLTAIHLQRKKADDIKSHELRKE